MIKIITLPLVLLISLLTIYPAITQDFDAAQPYNALVFVDFTATL